MPREELTLLTYQELLEILQDQESHLLIWNGFNNSLWIRTGYSEIFERMISDQRSIYEDARDMITECENDLEAFIWILTKDIDENDFLKKYVSNKVKYDFMKATHQIVKNGVRNVYNDENEGIYLLLKNFKNYFTLNFDSFLYLLLLKYKWPEKDTTIAFQQTFKFIEEDTNEKFNNTIYTEVKNARNNGTLDISIWKDSISAPLKELTKTHFTKAIMTYAKKHSKNWEEKDIKDVVDHIWSEEKSKNIIEDIDDWIKPQTAIDGLEYTKEYVYDTETETQNLFFLHGAFHLYHEGEEVKKITQTDNEALYDRLEDILNDWERDILCVFRSENKLEEINKNTYLRNALDKLTTLSGCLVIIGFWLSDNDQHIIDQINNSNLDTIYIASRSKDHADTYKKIKKIFWNKNVILFDRDTITYETPENLT